jgi:hypothetical protein
LKISWLIPTTILFLSLCAAIEAKADPCRLFPFYENADLPSGPSETELENDTRTETALVKEIDRRLRGQDFANLFATSPFQDYNPEERKDWLVCVAHYVQMDLNKNGLPDWTPVVDGALSEVLVANDNDLDGDGLVNIFDSSPLDARKPGRTSGSTGRARRARVAKAPASLSSVSHSIPPFLRAKEAPTEQAQLYKEFGILALDHSDHHSGPALRELLLVLREGLLPGMMPLKTIKFVYAFRGHDGVDDIAAYHRQTQALSIGGLAAYGTKDLTPLTRVRVLSAFAHEIGHALLFERLSPRELQEIGDSFGHWSKYKQSNATDLAALNSSDFFRASFLRPHPLHDLMRLGSRSTEASRGFIRLSLWSLINLTSEYAATNLHEWFADAFAASVLQRLGERGRLGSNWRPLLTRLPEHKDGYWVNYNNLTPEFRLWIERRLGSQAVRPLLNK